MANTVDFNKPLVSVVVPAYNAEAYLGNAFSRLQAQTLHNFEAIFVDDCSKDATTEILKDLVSRDSRFHWVRHEQNQGCGAARNTGIKRATGEYVICLDADDNYYSDLLENMVSALVSTDADIAVCNSVVVNAKTGEKRHFGQWRRLQERMSDDIMVVDHPCKCEDIASLIDYVAWSKMFRRTFFVEKALWFPNLKYYEDIPFSFLSCLLASRLVFLKKPLLEYYIMNTDSMTSWKIPKEFYMVDAFHHVLRRKELLDWKSVESNLMKRILDNIGAVYYSSNTSDEERAAIRTRMSGHVWDMWEVDRLLEQEILGDYGKRLCSEICQLSAPQFSVMLHGDTIGICGLSDPLSEKGYGEIGSLVDRCERLGLHACFTPDLAQGYGVNRLPDPEQKAQWLMELYGQSNISYIFDMSGGNLANEVLPYLSYPLIEKSEKIFIGYSDLTCILNAIYTKTGRPSILYRINNLYDAGEAGFV